MAILPKYQNQRYSQLLLDETQNYCRELGLQGKLEVHKNNPNAKKFKSKFMF